MTATSQEGADTEVAGRLSLLAILSFLNEEEHLPQVLDAMASQTRKPDRLVLVDDGSTDGSISIAHKFARRNAWASVLQRPTRSRSRDRLSTGAPVRAFQWALTKVDETYDVVAKIDADTRFTPRSLETVLAVLEADPSLGIVGPFLSIVSPKGRLERERCAPDHVRGPARFYRRQCWDEIAPLPEIVGWDSIDEIRARMRGWKTASFAAPDGDPVHLRPVGAHDGAMRGFRRRGLAAYAYGAHPLFVVLGAAARMRDRPRVIGGLAYLAGWGKAALNRAPRAEPELRSYARREQLGKLRRKLGPARRLRSTV